MDNSSSTPLSVLFIQAANTSLERNHRFPEAQHIPIQYQVTEGLQSLSVLLTSVCGREHLQFVEKLASERRPVKHSTLSIAQNDARLGGKN